MLGGFGKQRRAAGFSLVEAIVCVALIGGVAGGLFAARARAMAAFVAARETLLCAELCASLAEEVRAGARQPGQGEFANPEGYRWKIELAPGRGTPPTLEKYSVEVAGPSGMEETRAEASVWVLRQAPSTEGQEGIRE